jgi:hypothetical protein
MGETASEYSISCKALFGSIENSKWCTVGFRDGVWYALQNEIELAPAVRIGKTISAIAQHQTGGGSVRRYDHNGSTLIDSGVNVTCQNYFGYVGSDRWVSYIEINGMFYLIAAECL